MVLSRSDLLLHTQPSLVSAQEAASVEAATEHQVAIFEVDFAVVELAIIGVKYFATFQATVFLVHATNDDHADNGLVVVFALASHAKRVVPLCIYQQFNDFAIIQTVGALVDIDYRLRLTGLVVNGFPIAEDLLYLRRSRKTGNECKKEKESFFHT